MTRYFECPYFVVQDLRADIAKRCNNNFPYGWKGKKGQKLIKRVSAPTHVVYHQTAGSIVEGPEGPYRTAEYTTANPGFRCKSCGHVWEGTSVYPYENCIKCGKDTQNLGRGAGMPIMPYHVFVPFTPKRDELGRPVIYFCVDFVEETWHAEKGNRGIGCGFQGLFYSRYLPKFRPIPHTDGRPSEAQQALIYPIWDAWLKPLFRLKDVNLKGHFDFGKATCPGDFIEEKIVQKRGEKPNISQDQKTETSEWFDTWHERQATLVSLGYDCGCLGDLKNGVDGLPGEMTRRALEAFQKDSGIEVTGHWDPSTERVAETLINERGGYTSIVDHLPVGIKKEVVPQTSSSPTTMRREKKK